MRVHFHTTPADIRAVCEEVERKIDLKAYEGFQERVSNPAPGCAVCHDRPSAIPGLGTATAGKSSLSAGFVLVAREIDLVPGIRELLRPGQWERYLWATLDARAVDFQPGGIFGGDAIMMGEVMLQLSSPESRRIVRAFHTAFKRYCPARARGCFIGPEALERLHQGWRLTDIYDHPEPTLVDINTTELQMIN